MNKKSLENRLHILDKWFAAYGLRVRLCPDTHTIQWKGADKLPDWAREHLREFKDEFSEALRFRAGTCICCGLDPAVAPTTKGRRRTYDIETCKKGWEA